jgi:hypothetical protein
MDNIIKKADCIFIISTLLHSHNLVRAPASNEKPLATKFTGGVVTFPDS